MLVRRDVVLNGISIVSMSFCYAFHDLTSDSDFHAFLLLEKSRDKFVNGTLMFGNPFPEHKTARNVE